MSIEFYNQNAARFYESTVDVDMSALYERFIRDLPAGGRVLDAGCGSGRDSKAFLDMGYEVDALDASPKMVELASKLTGLAVQLKRFEDVDDLKEYDGIWTCASLLHVPKADLPIVLERLASALKRGGVWYVSFKYGSKERMKDGRHFTDLDEHKLAELTDALPDINIKSTWISEDTRPDRSEMWLNAVLTKS